YVLFSHVLPVSFGTALGMSADFAPAAIRLSALSIVLLTVPIVLISAAFFVDAWFLYKESQIALIMTILFFLLPLIGLLFRPNSFFIVHTAWDGFTLLMRL